MVMVEEVEKSVLFIDFVSMLALFVLLIMLFGR